MSYYVTIDDKRYLFCKRQLNEENKFQYELPKNVFEELKFEKKKKVGDEIISVIKNSNYDKKYFPEKLFMNFLLIKMDMKGLRGSFIKLNQLRNHIDIIHGKPDIEMNNSDAYKLRIDDLHKLIKIFNQVFYKNLANFFQKTRKFLRR